jgi:hypothetical protein
MLYKMRCHLNIIGGRTVENSNNFRISNQGRYFEGTCPKYELRLTTAQKDDKDIAKFKAKLTLCLTKYHTMKTYGNGGIAPHILNLNTRLM